MLGRGHNVEDYLILSESMIQRGIFAGTMSKKNLSFLDDLKTAIRNREKSIEKARIITTPLEEIDKQPVISRTPIKQRDFHEKRNQKGVFTFETESRVGIRN